MMATSRLITITTSHIGNCPSTPIVTKAELRRSLSAKGSRNRPRAVCSPAAARDSRRARPSRRRRESGQRPGNRTVHQEDDEDRDQDDPGHRDEVRKVHRPSFPPTLPIDPPLRAGPL